MSRVLNEQFDFLDDGGQIWSHEAQTRRRNAMMFDIWRNMFVVWMGNHKRSVIRVCLRIIPVQLFTVVPDFISVLLD